MLGPATRTAARPSRLAISAQHYLFGRDMRQRRQAALPGRQFNEFIMRETTTSQIIDDVRAFRSDIGILYLDDFNVPRVLQKAFADARATPILFDATVHVFVSETPPLLRRPQLSPGLTPMRATALGGKAPRAPSYCAEEPFSYIPCDHQHTDLGPRNALTTYHVERLHPVDRCVLSMKCNGVWHRSR